MLGGLGGRRPGTVLGGRRPLLGLLDEALGLGRGAGVVVGRLAGEPLLLDGQRAPRLLDLAVGAGAQLLGLALGGGAQLVGLLLGRQPELVGLALGGRDQVGGLAAGQRALLLGVGDQAAAVLVELLELDQAHVLGLPGGVGADRLGVAGRLLADLGRVPLGGLADLGRLLLREPQHRGGATAEAGVRRALVLGQLGLQRLDLLLEVERAALGLGQAVAEAGLLAAELADPGVDGVAVVAAAADHRERAGAGGAAGAAGWAGAAAGSPGRAAGAPGGGLRPALGAAAWAACLAAAAAAAARRASPGWRRPRRCGSRPLPARCRRRWTVPGRSSRRCSLLSDLAGVCRPVLRMDGNNPPRPATNLVGPG